jgi:hypothetical protein
MGGGSRALLEVWRTPLDLFSESFELKQKAELIQISIQTQIDTVGGRLKRKFHSWKEKSLQKRSRSPLKPINRLDTSTLTYHQ